MHTNFKAAAIGVILAIGMVFGVISANAAPEDYPSNSQQSVSLSSSNFGLNGPLSVDTTYSDQLGMVVTGKFLYGITPIDAILLEAALGPKEYRYAVTWGHQLNESQRFKLTAEHLAQKINYQFDSGDIDQWTGQNAFGADYQVLIPSSWLKAVDFNAYWAKANSKDLQAIIFANDTKMNFRRIAGATSRGASGGVSLQLWRDSLIRAAINYDEVRYHTRYQAGPDEQGFGETVSFEQRLTDRVKLKLTQSHRKIYDNYEAGIDWLVPTNPGHQLELGVHANRIQSNAELGNETRYGLKVAYSWGQAADANAKFVAPTVAMIKDIVQWSGTPAVHMQQVLAVADQKTVDYVKPEPAQALQPAIQTLQQKVIEVSPGETVNVSVGDKEVSAAELQALGLKFNKASHTIEGTVPETAVKKDYPVTLLAATAAMPLAAAASNLKQNQPRQLNNAESQQTLIFRVTNSPFAPKIKNPIPNFSQSIDQPAIDISLDKNQYFTNPLNGTAMVLSVAGLPSNLTATPSNDVNKISGTATLDNVNHGPYTITVTANNDPSGNHDPNYSTSQTFTLTITQGKPIYNGPASLPDATQTKAYSYDLAKDFIGQNITITVSNLPAGLSYTDGKIAGTPTASGSFALNVTAKNAEGSITPSINLTVLPAPTYNGPAQLPDAKLNQNYSYDLGKQFSPSNTTVAVNASSLPPGLSYDQSTGMITGQATTYGGYTLDVSATANGVTVHPPIKLDVEEKPSYDGTQLPDGATGQAYSFDLASHFKGSSLTITVSGLPTGLSYANGKISGTPTQFGSFTVDAKATNTLGVANPQLPLTIKEAPSYHGPATLPEGAMGHRYPSAGGQGYDLKSQFSPSNATVTVSGLPNGLTYANGQIVGQPTQTGTFKLTVSASNGGVTIHPPISVTIGTPPSYNGPTDLPKGAIGFDYPYPNGGGYDLKSQFSPSTATVTVTGLSGGLSYDASSGKITGTPTSGGTINFQAKASSAGIDLTENLSISVGVPPSRNSVQLIDAVEGIDYDSGPLTDLLSPQGTTINSVSGLPSGLSYDSSTTKITGKPASGTAGKNYKLMVVATHDGISKTFNNGEISLTINAAEKPSYTGPTTIAAGTLWQSYGGHDFANDFTPVGTVVTVDSITPTGSGLSVSGTQLTGGELKKAGKYTVSVTGKNGDQTTQQDVTLTIAEAHGELECPSTISSNNYQTICDSTYSSKCYSMSADGAVRAGMKFDKRTFSGSTLTCHYKDGLGNLSISNGSVNGSASQQSCSSSASACKVTTNYTQ